MSFQIDHPKNHPLQCLTEHHLLCLLTEQKMSPVMGWRVGSMVADFCHEISCQFANFIVVNKWKATQWTGESVFYCEGLSTCAGGGKVRCSQPYLRTRASRNAPLCKVKPFSSIGSVVNQLDAPFS